MRNKKRPFHFFLLAILLGIFVAYTIIQYPPSYFVHIGTFFIPLFPFVGVGFLLGIFSLCTYLFHSHLQGLLIAIFIGTYLTMRFVGITHFFFLLLLLGVFGSLEIFFLKRK